MKRFPTFTLLLAALTIAIHAAPAVTATFQFEPMAFRDGEIWRLFTGHLTHFGSDHLRWDLIAFIAFGSLVEIRSRRAWLICLGISATIISIGVAWFQPQFSVYRGLSGLDSALFAFVAADLLRTGWSTRDWLMLSFASVALAGFVAKSIYELSTGLTLFVEPSATFQAVPLAHLLGAIVGIAVACGLKTESKPTTAPRIPSPLLPR